MIRAVIFDYDGVIVNFPEIIWKERKAYLSSKHQITLTPADLEHLLGLVLDDQVTYLRRQYSLDITTAELSAHRQTAIDPILQKNLALLPGARELIENLKRNGFLLAIATNRARNPVEKELHQFNIHKHFDAIVTREDAAKPKPDPELFLIAARKLQVPPAECAVIEDSLPGIKAAKNAGMIAIGLCGAIHKRFTNADLSIHNLTELTTQKIQSLHQ